MCHKKQKSSKVMQTCESLEYLATILIENLTKQLTKTMTTEKLQITGQKGENK